MRGKTMFLRLFLTLLLMAGLTVNFQNIGINFGTAAHACGDDSDFFENWDFEDFEDYVNSGDSESDGIVGHVWDDSAEFFNKTSDETVDDVFDSLTELNHDDNSDSGGDDNNGSNSGSDEIPDGWGFHGTLSGGMIIDDVVFTEHEEESKEPEEQPEVVNNDDDDDEDEDPGDDEPTETTQESQYKEPEKDPDCSESSIQMSQQVSDLYNQESVLQNFNELREAANTDTEMIFSIGRDPVGNYSVSSAVSGIDNSSFAPRIPGMIATAHSHPKGDLSCFSISDFYSLASENGNDSEFSAIFVVGEYATYAMQVTDAAKLREFVEEHPRSEFVDPETGGFANVSDRNGVSLANEMYQDFRILLDIEHVSREDAFAHALSMLMSSQDVGVSMLKAEMGENGEAEFKEIKTSEVYNSETNELSLKATECQ